MRENFTLKQRKGFTLFELMIIVVIIIILTAIAIPNYLNMRKKAYEARAYEDLAFVAYLLEMFKIDWGAYPVVPAGEYFGKNTDSNALISTLAIELTGSGIAPPYVNIKDNKTLTGHDGGIDYCGVGKFTSLYNPFNSESDYHYRSDPTGSNWVLSLKLPNGKVLYRTFTILNLIEADAEPMP